MAVGHTAGNFKISGAPLASSALHRETEANDFDELPGHYSKPLLFAVPRNPQTLFVCWSVDWPAAFAADVPADRKAYLKIKGGASERIHAVEPLSGSCSVAELEPGETYAIEIGYHGAGARWQKIAIGNEVMMPLQGADSGGVNVATVPFHLTFQRLVDLFATTSEKVVETLAEFQERATQGSSLCEDDERILRALGLSAEHLRATVAACEKLAKTKVPLRSGEGTFGFGGSSPGGSNWGGS